MPKPPFTNLGQIIQTGLAAASLSVTAINAKPSLAALKLFGPGPIAFYLVFALVLWWLWSVKSKRPNIAVLEVSVREKLGLMYPLKCRLRMRNDSTVCIDVQVTRFIPKAVTLKKFVTSVLQVKLNDDLQPSKEGVDRLAVLPQQQFQAWIGVDETKFTSVTLPPLLGHAGTLVLRVNGEDVEINV